MQGWRATDCASWIRDLQANAAKNRKTVLEMANDDQPPLNYYAAYKPVRFTSLCHIFERFASFSICADSRSSRES